MIDPEQNVRQMQFSAQLTPKAQVVANKQAGDLFDKIKKMAASAWNPIDRTLTEIDKLPPSYDPFQAPGPLGMVDNMALLGVKGIRSLPKLSIATERAIEEGLGKAAPIYKTGTQLLNPTKGERFTRDARDIEGLKKTLKKAIGKPKPSTEFIEDPILAAKRKGKK